MTNLQLLLLIGTPTFAIIVEGFLNHGRFGSFKGHFARIETRLTSIEGDLRRFIDLGPAGWRNQDAEESH